MSRRRLDARPLVVELVRELNRVGGRSGTTQIQRCTFFLRHLLEVPLSYDFVIYHYGPFSFELDEDLVLMRWRGWLAAEGDDGYGVRYLPGPKAPRRLPSSLRPFQTRVRSVAQLFGRADARKLELLATSFYIQRQLVAEGRDCGEVVAAVRRLKPHFGEEEISAALDELQNMRGPAASG